MPAVPAVPAKDDFAGVLTFLHGWDDRPDEAEARHSRFDPSLRWALRCPAGPVATLGGRAWFRERDTPGPPTVASWIALLDPSPPRPAVAGGFSQGGAVALAAALQRPITGQAPLDGLFCLGGYLLAPDVVDYDFEARAGLPVLIAHGSKDEVVPVQQALAAARLLDRRGLAVWFEEIHGAGHDLDALLAVLGTWLASVAAGERPHCPPS